MIHVCGFSGGVPSAVMSEMVAKENPGATVLLFHDTKTEPEDNARFRSDVSAYFGIPVTDYSDGRDIWQVFDDEGFLGNGRNTPCSRLLKQRLSLKYMKDNQPATLYIGFTPDEWARAQRLFVRYQEQNILVRFPLIENNVVKLECFHRVETCWGIRPAENYEWAEHANCIPCVKGKKAYWGLIYMYEKWAWEKTSQAEKDFGHTIFTEAGSLEAELDNCLRLAEKYLAKKKDERRQVSLIEFPCECAV